MLATCYCHIDYTAHAQVGNSGLLENEQRSHFALWCLLKSPLFIGADLRKLSKSALEILTATEVIAVNQDPLGVAGDLIWKEGPIEVTCSCIYVSSLHYNKVGCWSRIHSICALLANCVKHPGHVHVSFCVIQQQSMVAHQQPCHSKLSFSTLNVKPRLQLQ